MRFGLPYFLGAFLLLGLLPVLQYLVTSSSSSSISCYLTNSCSSSQASDFINGLEIEKDDHRLLPTRTKYSGLPVSDGLVFHVDRHFVRRRRRRRSADEAPRDTRDANLRGLARDCGRSCHVRLRSRDNVSYKLHLHLWHQMSHPHNSSLPHLHNHQMAPIVQYFDGPDSVSARMSTASPNCIYKAHIVGSDDHTIVNLCDSDDGLYGLLALPDKGVFTVEPFNSHTNESSRHVPHVAHPLQTQKFHNFDDTHMEESTVNISTYDQGKWEDTNERKTRSRRAANSWDHYVEVMVVTDVKMHEYHGYNLEDYVLTLFSTVASIYRHQSLKASINVVVVKIVILKHENQGPVVSSNAQDTLQRFCRWQSLYNERNDDSPNHHDVAILLTRGDICRAPGKCDTLGLAELGTMCDWQKSCAIIEDNGLSAAFTIAHELGHIFNIPHDDERRCGQYMQVTKNNFHIMAPTLEYNTHPWSWSACSSGMLEKFLDNNRGQIQCLFDQPVQRKYYEQLFEGAPAGRKYDVNQQCKFVFGPQSELCPYMPTCRRLWCATYYGSQMGCRTQHMPWADGTPCDKSDGPKYCHRGECVNVAPERRSRTDGGWGDWQPWGSCSRSCGGGVQKALRDCDNPRPSNGGKYCIGQREQYMSCNTQECSWDLAGFRESQCAEFDNKDVGIHGVDKNSAWIPKYTGVASNERCKLYCRIKGTAAAYLLRDKVLDGTPCDRDGDDICVDGTCMKAGCDHVLNSSMRKDRCGICGGDGTTCRTVKGKFNERGNFGYNEVLKIPAGSANIDIRQHGYHNRKDDDNYLSLRSANGEFLLNGHFQVSVFRQHIPVQDVFLEYSGSDTVVEIINGTGPIRSDIYVHVLSVGELYPPDISYEYMTSVQPTSDRQRVASGGYFWRYSDRWSACDKSCQGSQTQEPICFDAMNNRPTNERFCRTHKPAINKRVCNMDCTIKWQTEDLTRCSVACGSGEKRVRVQCVRIDHAGRTTNIREQECDRNSRPSERVACHVDCSGRRWSYTEWSPCSVTCGEGLSTRNSTCVDSHGRKIDVAHCDSHMETLVRACSMHPCPRWEYGHWSECSRSCDGGVRMRHSQCLDAAGRETDPRRCGPKIDRESCNEHLCTGWTFGAWSECSVSCGDGIQTRDARCMDRSQRLLDESKCNSRERITSKPCSRPACPVWKQGEWTSCSVSCQDGWSTRRVSCVDHLGQDVAAEKCRKSGIEQPASHKPCNQGPCPFWRTSEWTPCSVSCGSGIRQRHLECVYRQQVVDNSFCGDTPAPDRTQTCSLVPCTSWQATPWTSCSVTCGTGQQTRQVFCVSDKTDDRLNDAQCDKNTRPRTSKVCERESCQVNKLFAAPLSEVPTIGWHTGPYGACSSSCGKGTKRRQVKCRDHVRNLPDDYCRNIEKPEEMSSCQMKPCAYWKSGPWMPCPATCGIHVQQTRSVMCVAYDRSQTVTETDCDVSERPPSIKSCKLDICPLGEPPLGRWRSGEWDKCSASCDGGWRRRQVTCSASVCDDSTKPKAIDACNTHVCPKTNNAWQISPWTHCSVSCGGGVQRRRVWCEDATTFRSVDDVECRDIKPSELKDCELSPCEQKQQRQLSTQWQTAPWSSCSVKCGRGIRRRIVACVDTATNSTLATTRCEAKEKPVDEIKCRMTHCPRWRGTPWGTCSVSCGAGVRQRDVYCQLGRRQRTNDTECAASARPPTEAKCYQPPCPAYHWMTTPWSKCSDGCAKSSQHRRVYCMSNSGKRAAPRMCNTQQSPPTSRQCDITKCPYEWVPGPWQTCSKTCGPGIQTRNMECRVKTTHPHLMTDSAVPMHRCESLPVPKDRQECNLNPCEADYQWSIGAWEACSKTCGQGVRRRKVRCYQKDGQRVPKQHCEAISQRPRRAQTCFERNCLPSTCQEIRSQAKTPSPDGNYTVLLDGFPLQVYCHRMNQTIPGTYINLKPETNFAEVYGKRLIFPHTCPHNGERNDSCQCSEYGDAHAGFTKFSKIRVDLLNRKMKTNDYTFTETVLGTHVEYGSAGDCYSMKDCPQGRFSVDLTGTGLRIVDDLQWEDKGHRTTSRIDRTENNAKVEGRCGGYCGKCSPDKYKGLVFEIDTSQVKKV